MSAGWNSEFPADGFWSPGWNSRTAHAPFQLHNPGVGLVETHIRTRGLPLQTYPPVARVLFPEREIRIHQRIGQLFESPLDIDA